MNLKSLPWFFAFSFVLFLGGFLEQKMSKTVLNETIKKMTNEIFV